LSFEVLKVLKFWVSVTFQLDKVLKLTWQKLYNYTTK